MFAVLAKDIEASSNFLFYGEALIFGTLGNSKPSVLSILPLISGSGGFFGSSLTLKTARSRLFYSCKARNSSIEFGSSPLSKAYSSVFYILTASIIWLWTRNRSRSYRICSLRKSFAYVSSRFICQFAAISLSSILARSTSIWSSSCIACYSIKLAIRFLFCKISNFYLS